MGSLPNVGLPPLPENFLTNVSTNDLSFPDLGLPPGPPLDVSPGDFPGIPDMRNFRDVLNSLNISDLSPIHMSEMPSNGSLGFGGNPLDDARTYEGVEAVNIVQIFVCTIGLIANITVILLVLILKELKKGITLWYILQLAIADTLFLITLPFQILEDQNREWAFPEWLCKAKHSVMFINYYSTISFLTVMAIDRYIAVCHIFSDVLLRLRTRKAAYIITAIVWTVCILITIPVMLSSTLKGAKPNCKCMIDFSPRKTHEELCAEISGGEEGLLQFCLSQPANDGVCVDPPKPGEFGPFNMMRHQPQSVDGAADIGCHYDNEPYGLRVFIIVNFAVMFLLPLVFIAGCYALIIRHLRKVSFRSDGHSSNTKSRKRVIYMCVTLVFVFLSCWLPYHAQHLAKLVGITGHDASFCVRLVHITSLIVYFNSAINPFIYFIIARLKSHVKNITRSRAASAVLTLFSRNGQRTMTTRNTTNRSEKTKGENENRTTDVRDTTESRSNV